MNPKIGIHKNCENEFSYPVLEFEFTKYTCNSKITRKKTQLASKNLKEKHRPKLLESMKETRDVDKEEMQQ